MYYLANALALEANMRERERTHFRTLKPEP